MYLLFDIGATHMRMAISADGHTLKNQATAPTPAVFAAGIDQWQRLAERLCAGAPVQAIAGGIAGRLTAAKTAIRWSPNLPGWVGQPLTEAMTTRLALPAGQAGAPLYVENDAALGGLGEAVRGAGQGYSIVAYLTISTGVGGARIVAGEIDHNAHGFEPGQQIIHAGHTLEHYISGRAIEKRYGKKLSALAEAAAGKEFALRLAEGLNNTIVHWSPQVVVLGGGVMEHVPHVIEMVNHELQLVCRALAPLPSIRLAALGERSGLEGALLYLQSHVVTS